MALFPFTLNDQTFQQSDFGGYAYIPNIPAAIEQLIRHGLRPYWKQSSNSIVIGTGVKALTGITGANFSVGDAVLCYSSSVNYFAGNVTAYSSTSGNMTVNSTAAVGGGSGTVTVIRIGEKADLLVSAAPLEPLLGGTGGGGTMNRNNSLPASQFAASEGGQGASSFDAMFEVYDDFMAWDADATNTAPNGQMNGWINSPYFYSNCKNGTPFDIIGPAYLNSPDVIGGNIWMMRSARSVPSAVLRYGDNGFVLPGGGSIRFETTVMIDAVSTGYDPANYRMGLRGQSSGKAQNIFSACGCGFEITNGSNGRYNTFVGSTQGGVLRQMTSVAASGRNGFDRLSIYIAPDGNRQRFFINGQLVADAKFPMGTQKVLDMLHPAYEIQVIQTGLSDAMIVLDSLWLRKNLTR